MSKELMEAIRASQVAELPAGEEVGRRYSFFWRNLAGSILSKALREKFGGDVSKLERKLYCQNLSYNNDSRRV